jgi:hypothetical protein
MLSDLQLLPLEGGRAVLPGLFTGIFLAFELGVSGCIILALLHRVFRIRALAIAFFELSDHFTCFTSWTCQAG